jgi:hypothetical protein
MSKKWTNRATTAGAKQEYRRIRRRYNRPWWKLVRWWDDKTARHSE